MEENQQPLKTTSANLSLPDPGHCPYCGIKRRIKIIIIESLGCESAVVVRCDCELEAHEKEMARLTGRGERQRIEAALQKSGLTHLAANMTFASFEPRPGTEKALSVAREFAQDFDQRLPTGEAFILIGGYGSGKSHLAAAVVHELVGRGTTASFQVVPELLKRLRASYNRSDETEAEIYKELENVKCLVLDDAGAQKQTKWAEQTLYYIIDFRYRHRLPTIITSNCGAIDGEKSLTEALSGRAVDRILERNKVIKMTAPSFRLEWARQRLAREGRYGK